MKIVILQIPIILQTLNINKEIVLEKAEKGRPAEKVEKVRKVDYLKR